MCETALYFRDAMDPVATMVQAMTARPGGSSLLSDVSKAPAKGTCSRRVATPTTTACAALRSGGVARRMSEQSFSELFQSYGMSFHPVRCGDTEFWA